MPRSADGATTNAAPEENHRELLDAAGGHSKRDVEELLARRFPRPDVPSSVRKVPERRPVAIPDSSPVARMESSLLAPSPAFGPAQPIVPPSRLLVPNQSGVRA